MNISPAPSVMNLPVQAAPVLRGHFRVYHAGTLQQQQLNCALCCIPKAGFAACVAACAVTGQACDGGVSNCTPCG